MGRKSPDPNKNIYWETRESLGWSREKALEELEMLTERRLEAIEKRNQKPRPDEVEDMATVYKVPSLRNFYCAKQCPIGKHHVYEGEVKDLPAIVLQTVLALDSLDNQKHRFMEIAADGSVDDSEVADFQAIKESLDKIIMSAESIRLWADQMDQQTKA